MENNKPDILISFIIPVYNASLTIQRCLDSIYSLPLEETKFEVVIIDDCSSDNSVQIIQRYSLCHPNIVLLMQPENHRQGAARNRGISVSKGAFISFVDSDDEVAEGIVSAIKQMISSKLDMIALHVDIIDADGNVERQKVLNNLNRNVVFTGCEFQTHHPFWGTAPWAYLFYKEFIKSVGYPFAENVIYEDSDFINVHLYHAHRMSYCEVCAYKMHYNSESITHTFSYKHVCDYALLGSRMLDFYKTIESKGTKYSESILEGGSYNIMRACKNLFKLTSSSDLRSFYDRFDSFVDRKTLLHYREPKYCWTIWTRFCLRYRKMTTLLVGLVLDTRILRLLKSNG